MISRRKRQERLKRNYKKYSLQIPRLMKQETTMELDFTAGYLIGQFEAAYEYGELSEKQRYRNLTKTTIHPEGVKSQ